MRVNREKFDFDGHFVNQNRLSPLNLIEGTNSSEEVNDCAVVFHPAKESLRKSDAEVVCVDSLVAFLGFGVGIDGEELGGDGCGVHGLRNGWSLAIADCPLRKASDCFAKSVLIPCPALGHSLSTPYASSVALVKACSSPS